MLKWAAEADNCCLWLQVLTGWQAALVFVTSYPCLPNRLMSEALAEKHGEPCVQASQGVQRATNQCLTWNHVNQYTRTISVGNMFSSVPFLPNVSQRLLCS